MGRKSQPNNIRELKGDPNLDRYKPDGLDPEKLLEVPAPPQWLFTLARMRTADVSPVDIFNEKAKWLVGVCGEWHRLYPK